MTVFVMIACVFKDRPQAGAGLAAALPDLRLKSNVTVVGLARGGVEVAAEAAHLLQLPLDVLCIRKVGMPGYPELAMGAVAPQGERFTNRRIASLLTTRQIEEAYDAAMAEARAMDERLRGSVPMNLIGRVAVIIDDGLARFETTVYREVQAGDHVLVPLELHAVDHSDVSAPLFFHRSAFGRFAAPEVAASR